MVFPWFSHALQRASGPPGPVAGLAVHDDAPRGGAIERNAAHGRRHQRDGGVLPVAVLGSYTGWENSGKTWENPWENPGKTLGNMGNAWVNNRVLINLEYMMVTNMGKHGHSPRVLTVFDIFLPLHNGGFPWLYSYVTLLVNCIQKYWTWPSEIVSFPITGMVIFPGC